MKTEKEICANRLNTLLSKDKKNCPLKLADVVKFDVMAILKNYFSVTDDNCSLKINVTECGEVEITLKATARNIIPVYSI